MANEITLDPALVQLIEQVLITEAPEILDEIEKLLAQLDSTLTLKATRRLVLRDRLRALVASLPVAPATPPAPPAA